MKNLLYISILIFLFSCTRQQIKISAINPATGEPYAGLNYTISKNVTGAFETNSHVVKKGTLNEQGIALVTLNLSHYRSYVIGLESPGEHCYENNTSYTFSNTDKSFDFVFKIAPCAYLKLNINNVNCQGASDTMVFRTKYPYTDWESWSSNRIGCYSYQSPYSFKVSAGWRIYEWKVNRSGVITTHIDSIYLNSGVENGTFNINY